MTPRSRRLTADETREITRLVWACCERCGRRFKTVDGFPDGCPNPDCRAPLHYIATFHDRDWQKAHVPLFPPTTKDAA